MMKAGSNDSFLFAGANNRVDGLCAAVQGKVDRRVGVTTGGLVALGAESGQIFLVHRRKACECLCLFDG